MEAGAAAGADAVAAGAVSAFAAGVPPALSPAAAWLELPSPELAGGLADEYKSLYQPEPLNCTAGAVKVRSSVPPQCGHTVSSASENFWIFSVRRWQAVHWYS